jgi:glycosyltransferase 2 family protein
LSLRGRLGRLLGFLLTAFFLWLVARNVSLDELVTAFRGADYRMIAPAAMITLTGYFLRTVRWQRIVRPVAGLGFGDAFSILMMGFASNNLLPARLGEFVRAYLLGRKIGVRKTYGMATILLERVCDGLTLIAFLGGVSLMWSLPGWGQEVQWISSLLFVAATLGIIALLAREALAVRVLSLVLTPFPEKLTSSLLRATSSFITGLHSLRSKRSLALVALLSVIVWSLEASSYLLMCQAFGAFPASTPISQQMLAATFLLVVVNLGIMIPSAPGYVGTFQFFAVMALGAFSVPKETALAVAISSHLMQYLLVTAIGLFYFARGNLAFWRFEKTAGEETEDDTEEISLSAAAHR